MHIEVISRGDVAHAHRPSLLFIHGGCHGAWCWDEFLLPWFASRGWHANALSLRGHGSSDGRESISRWTLADYEDDVGQVLEQIARPTVLIGHSIGGVLAQRSWERRSQVAGMILYATSPLKPDMAVILRLLRQRPFSVLAGQVFGIASAQMRTIEQILFSPAFDPEKVKAYRSRLCLESPKAMAELFTRAPQKRADGDHRPALVVAGSDDWSIPLPSHEALAEAFKAELKVCPGAHDLMLDPQWESNARAMDDWLSASYPSSQS
jgi:pimeloyl-ACP methyl ester carboxylesterase